MLVLAIFIGIVILYLVIKWAVKHAIIEAKYQLDEDAQEQDANTDDDEPKV